MFKNDKNLKYFFIFYFVYYISMGVYFPFVNVHFERLGFTGSQIGSIASIGLLFAMVTTPLWGTLSDRSKNKKFILGFVMICTAICAYIWGKQNIYMYVLIISIIYTIFRSSINPLSDSLTVNYCAKKGHDFGKIRAIGSLGYVVGSFVIANIASHFGLQGPYIFIVVISLLLSVGILFFYPSIEIVKEDKQQKNYKEDIKKLLNNKNYIFIIIVMLFTNQLMDSAGGYVGNHLINNLRGNQSTIGLYTLIAALPEVLFIMLISNIIHRWGYKKLYLTACVIQMLRCIAYAFIGSLPLFLIISVVHTVMTGVGSVAHLKYMNKVVDSKVMTTALSLYTSIYLIFQAIYTQIFGIIYELFGSRYIFLATALLTLVGFMIVYRSKRFDTIV